MSLTRLTLLCVAILVQFFVCLASSTYAQNAVCECDGNATSACDALLAHSEDGDAKADDLDFRSSWLRGNSIQIKPVYVGEVFSNTRGGITTKDATRYLGLLDLGFEWNFEETQAAVPGKFYLLAQNTHGKGITTDFVGDSQVVSNIDSFKNIMQVSEYWLELATDCGVATVRLGKQDINTEFLFINQAENFIQSTFGLSPSTAFPTYPDPSMAAVLMLQLTESWRLKTGLWDAFASGGSWGFSGNDSFVLISELERTYALADGRLPGVLAFGAVYESEGVINDDPVSSVFEYIFQLEQLVYREHDSADDAIQGLGLFVGYYPRSLGSQILLESIGDSCVAGAVYTGLIPGRDQDVFGVGLAWTELFQGGTNEETVAELFYKAQLTPRVRAQPDIQFVKSPSGIYRDALVAGFRFQVDF